MQAQAGKWSEVKPPNVEVQNICDEVKSQAEEMAGKTFPQFLVETYRNQLVAGMNNRIKVFVGDLQGSPSFWKLSVFQDLPANGGALTVTGIELLVTDL